MTTEGRNENISVKVGLRYNMPVVAIKESWNPGRKSDEGLIVRRMMAATPRLVNGFGTLLTS